MMLGKCWVEGHCNRAQDSVFIWVPRFCRCRHAHEKLEKIHNIEKRTRIEQKVAQYRGLI